MSDRAFAVVYALYVFIAMLVVGTMIYFVITPAPARVWQVQESPTTEEKVRHDFLRDALQYRPPENPNYIPAGCCGEGDAYEADDFDREADGTLVAILTCNQKNICKEICMYRDDGEGGGDYMCRPQRPPGFRIRVPFNKYGSGPRNPTGHGWIFLRTDGTVYCYFFPEVS